MRKIFLMSVMCAVMAHGAAAQEMTEAQKAAAEAAKAVSAVPEAVKPVEKPKYWSETLMTNITFGQTSLTNWAAGGDNTVTLGAYIDGNANYKKNDLFWNNRLQLNYGFIYGSSKPILQKSTDLIQLQSSFGYRRAKMKNFYFSANYSFRSQFTKGYNYLTPAVPADRYPEGTGLDDIPRKEQVKLWKDARLKQSGFLSPAYTNLALGMDLVPAKWLSLNFAPLAGDVVIVTDAELRKNYGMALKERYEDLSLLPQEEVDKYNAAVAEGGAALGAYYKSARFAFGAQLRANISVRVNDNFAYTSQLVLFSNYLDHPENLRVNWDNRIDWKLAKYFSLTLIGNMIYDDKVMIYSEKDGQRKQRIQFMESLSFGFVYTIAHKS